MIGSSSAARVAAKSCCLSRARARKRAASCWTMGVSREDYEAHGSWLSDDDGVWPLPIVLPDRLVLNREPLARSSTGKSPCGNPSAVNQRFDRKIDKKNYIVDSHALCGLTCLSDRSGLPTEFDARTSWMRFPIARPSRVCWVAVNTWHSETPLLRVGYLPDPKIQKDEPVAYLPLLYDYMSVRRGDGEGKVINGNEQFFQIALCADADSCCCGPRLLRRRRRPTRWST